MIKLTEAYLHDQEIAFFSFVILSIHVLWFEMTTVVISSLIRYVNRRLFEDIDEHTCIATL